MPYLNTGRGFDLGFHFKGGSTAMRKSLGLGTTEYSGKPYNPHDVRLVLREPRARLNSWLKMKKRDTHPDDFDIDYEVRAMTNGHNPHWNPVTPLFVQDGIFTPTSVVRFEDINTWWPEWLPDVPLERHNQTEDEDLIGPYIHHFDVSHEKDTRLWNAIPSGSSLTLTPGQPLESLLETLPTLTDIKKTQATQ